MHKSHNMFLQNMLYNYLRKSEPRKQPWNVS